VTLAVAIKATDAIVVASDSRGTIGDPRGLTAVNDVQQKVFQFGTCGLAIAGQSEVALAILDEFGKAGIHPASIDEAVAAFTKAAELCEGWYRGIPPGQRPGVIFIVGGYRMNANNPPAPMVYILNSQASFAPQLANNYPMMAGVPQYAVYLSHRYYDPAMSGENAAALAAYLISETASQDPKVGGPLQIARVTPTGYQQLTTEQIEDLQKKNSALNASLKKFFAT
jgi:20S proteasome alpha/beta subunit